MPLVIATALTCVLAFAVIRGVSMEVSQRNPNPRVDVQQVEELIKKGRISGREAKYWEIMPSSAETK